MTDRLVTVRMFKAARDSHRFRANQRVWVRHFHANHMEITFRWRGKGSYVSGIIDRCTNTSATHPRKIEVSADFAERHRLEVVERSHEAE